MKRTCGAWRRRLSAAARWTLTMLLVGLVGVTVASGWYWLHWRQVRFFNAATPSVMIDVSLRRGTVTWVVRTLDYPLEPWLSIVFERDPPPPGSMTPRSDVLPPTPPFNLWRFDQGIPLAVPSVALAIPTLALWYLWYRRRRKLRKRGHCADCGYDLAGLSAVDEQITCPECGAATPAT